MESSFHNKNGPLTRLLRTIVSWLTQSRDFLSIHAQAFKIVAFRLQGVVLVSSTASLHEMANVFTWGDCRDEEQKLAWIQNSLLRTVLGLSEKDVRWIAENTLVAKSKTV